jgi:hypothetical protein
VIAAGHAAGYALAHGCDHPDAFERLVLLAPTWRGPLPTMMKGAGHDSTACAACSTCRWSAHCFTGSMSTAWWCATWRLGTSMSIPPGSTANGWSRSSRTDYGAQTPRGSRAEIEALATIPGMSSLMLRIGKLSFYEEFPDATAGAILPFLAEGA